MARVALAADAFLLEPCMRRNHGIEVHKQKPSTAPGCPATSAPLLLRPLLLALLASCCLRGARAAAPPPELGQTVSCTLGASCTIYPAGPGRDGYFALTDAASHRRRIWQPSTYFPANQAFDPDASTFWLWVTETPETGDPCASGTAAAMFTCHDWFGPVGPPPQWQNPRGNNFDDPPGYELCPNGATAGDTRGNYSLCWADNLNDVADPPFQHIGWFEMHGPEVSTVSCTMGQPCSVYLSGRLDDPAFDASAVLVLEGVDTSSCRSKPYTAEAIDFNDAERKHGQFNGPVQSVAYDGEYRQYDLGIATTADGNQPTSELDGDNQNRGLYRVCWGVSLASLDPSSPDFGTEMRKGVDVGPFYLYGPVVGRNTLSCVLTLDCYWELEGKFYTDMPYALLLSYEDDCGNASLQRAAVSGGTWTNPLAGVATSTFSFRVSFGAPTRGEALSYTVCWGAGATQDSDYAVRIGTLTISGPYGCEGDCSCYKGDDCSVFLQVTGLTEAQSSRNRIQILEPGSTCGLASPPLADLTPELSETLINGDRFDVGKVKSGVADPNYTLCWGAGLHWKETEYDYVFNDFECTFHIGTFQMLGPNWRDMECTLGLLCEIQLTGYALADTNGLVILEDSEDATRCEDVVGAELAQFRHLGEVLYRGDYPAYSALEAGPAPHDTFSMGIPDGVLNKKERTSYLVCWANAPADFSVDYFTVPVGKLVLVGPEKQAQECQLSMFCTITIKGIGLSSTNGLMIIPLDGHKCGVAPLNPSSIDGVENPKLTDGVSGSSFVSTEQVYHFGIPGSAPEQPGENYQLCWAHDPNDEESYRVFVGFFFLAGIYIFSEPPCGDFTVGKDPYCILGEECIIGQLPEQRTIVLDVENPAPTNRIVIIKKTQYCCGAESGHKLAWFGEIKPSNLPADVINMPNPITVSGGGYETYDLGRPTLPLAIESPAGTEHGIPGNWLMCWSHDPSLDVVDYNTAAGTLQIRGPHPQETSCTLGEFCWVPVKGIFYYFDDEDPVPTMVNSRSYIRPSEELCGEEATTLDPPWVGMDNPCQPAAPEYHSDDMITYYFETGVENAPSVSYKLCWSYSPAAGASIEKSAEYRVTVGTFTMNGPYQGQQISCNLGAPCTIEITGIGLASTNRLLVISEYGGPCGSIPPDAPMLALDMDGITNPRLVTNDVFDNKYDMGLVSRGGSYSTCRVAEPRETCIGTHYRMCWSHGVNKNSLDDFPYQVDIGSFHVVGAFGTYSVECSLGAVCAFNIFGLDFATVNQVLIIDSRGQCGDADPLVAAFEGLHNPRRASSVADAPGGGMQATFRLGRSLSGNVGTFRLCWGYNPLKPAHFRVEVGPFHFVESPEQQSCSVWDNHCYQKSSL